MIETTIFLKNNCIRILTASQYLYLRVHYQLKILKLRV